MLSLAVLPQTTNMRVVTKTMKSLSEQHSDCCAEIKYLEDRLNFMKGKHRPNPISVLRLENELATSRRHLAEIEGQVQRGI